MWVWPGNKATVDIGSTLAERVGHMEVGRFYALVKHHMVADVAGC